MKRWMILFLTLLLLILPLGAYASQVVSYTADFYVADYANVLSDEVEGLIVLNNDRLDEACGAQIVVVTVNSVNGSNIENYAYTLFNEWKIGSKTKNNGLLLLIAVNDGQYWFMPGKGLQDYLNAGDLDALATEHFIPSAQNGNFDEAIRQLFGACFDKVSVAYNAGLSVDETLYYSWLQSGSTGIDGAVYLPQPLRDMSAVNQQPQPTEQPQQNAQTQQGSTAKPQQKEGGSIWPFVIIALVVIAVIGVFGSKRGNSGKAHRPAPRPAHKPHPAAHPAHPAPRPASRPPMGGAPRPAPRPPMGGAPRPAPRPPMGGASRPAARPPMGGASRPAARPPMGSTSRPAARPPMGGASRPVSRPPVNGNRGGGFGGGRSGGGGSTRGGGTGGRF